jgi:hypothetical protein
MSFHTAYPNWDSQAVVCHLFLYSCYVQQPLLSLDCQNFVYYNSLVFFPYLGNSPGAGFQF